VFIYFGIFGSSDIAQALYKNLSYWRTGVIIHINEVYTFGKSCPLIGVIHNIAPCPITHQYPFQKIYASVLTELSLNSDVSQPTEMV
jgi:hypothetical protein